jgi:hypothetical protein
MRQPPPEIVKLNSLHQSKTDRMDPPEDAMQIDPSRAKQLLDNFASVASRIAKLNPPRPVQTPRPPRHHH